jgi:hypothetical protein
VLSDLISIDAKVMEGNLAAEEKFTSATRMTFYRGPCSIGRSLVYVI